MSKLVMVERRSLFRAPSTPDRDTEEPMKIRPAWGVLVVVWAVINGLQFALLLADSWARTHR